MIGVYVMLALSIVLGLGAIIVGVLALRKKGGGGVTLADVHAENERLRENVDNSVRMSGAMTTGALNAQAQNTKDLSQKVDHRAVGTANALGEMKLYVAESLKKVADENAKNLAEVKADNQKQLEKMRETVDEKLSSRRKRT